jgi:nitrogen-specific signal transduction histidine kinase
MHIILKVMLEHPLKELWRMGIEEIEREAEVGDRLEILVAEESLDEVQTEIVLKTVSPVSLVQITPTRSGPSKEIESKVW